MTKPTSDGVASFTRKGFAEATGKDLAGRPFGRAMLFAALYLAGSIVALTMQPAVARDRGQYANTSPELKAWFDSLRSERGPCCSDADGSAVSDVDWESKDGQYRVRIEGEWVMVPDDAVIKVPNRIGRTMVWPIYLEGRPVVRCFMPGSMT